MTKKSANEVLNIMRGLSTDEKKSLVDQILKMVQLGDEDGASKRDDLVSLKNGRRPVVKVHQQESQGGKTLLSVNDGVFTTGKDNGTHKIGTVVKHHQTSVTGMVILQKL